MARKQKTIHYIYKTTCLVTGRYYIGMHSTSNIDDGYMGSGKRLRRSMRKHGIDNHKKEIIEFFDTRELLIEAEKKAITLDMIQDNNCMNLMGGGEGGFISEEQQRHRSICANKKLYEKLNNDIDFKNNWNKKKSEGLSRAHKNGKMIGNLGNRFTGKHHTNEAKKKISKSASVKQKGDKNSQYGTCWITKDGLNKKIKKEIINLFINEGWVKGYYIKPSLNMPNLILLKEENEKFGPTWCARKYNTSRPTIARWISKI